MSADAVQAAVELATPGQAPVAEGRWLTARRARLIGWAAFAIGTALRVLQLWLIGHMGPDSLRFAFDIGVPTFLAAIALGTASSIVGVLIVSRHPTNTVGWLYVFTGVAEGLATAGLSYAALVLPSGPDPVATFAVWFNGVVDFTIPFAFAAVVLVLFPDGRLPGRAWRWVVVLAVVGGSIRTLEVGFGEPTMVLLASAANPYSIGGRLGDLLRSSSTTGVGSLLVEASFVLAAASLAARYRSGSIDARRQIRWIVLAGFVAVLGTVPLVVDILAPGVLPPRFDAIGLLFAALTLAPIATLIAITRYRLYEIDRIVNRALLYGSLTAILAGVFTAGIALAQRLFVSMTGERSDGAIVATTLIVATLYAPLRKRLELLVDRRFKYESRQFGAYRDELSRLLSATDPVRAAQRLVGNATAELGSVGGAVLDPGGRPLATEGEWPAEVVLRVSLKAPEKGLDALVLGPRRDGRSYDPGTVAALEDLASLVGAAVRERPIRPA